MRDQALINIHKTTFSKKRLSYHYVRK